MSGWVGVAGHIGPLAHVDQALWRAATTLTYANAAAGLLVPLALLALAKAAESASRVETMLRCLAVTTLLVGIEATFSRGGAFALLVGLAVLFGLTCHRRRLVGMLVSALVGSGIAIAGLLPGIPDSSTPHWALAIASMLLGLGTAAALAVTLNSRALLGWTVGLVGVSALAAALFVPTMRHAVVAVAHPRLNPASSDRAHESSAALDEIRAHPLVGVGPGIQQLQWSGPDGAVYSDQYAHDEYLQLAWKSGLVGLGLVLAMFVAIGRRIVRGRIGPASPGMWGGAVAGLAALATASGFDFLWHLPVIPLVGALLAGLSSNSEEQPS
jgi:O-antigen ligase